MSPATSDRKTDENEAGADRGADDERTTRPRRVLLIGNPRARSGADAETLVEPLREQGLEVVFETPDGLDALHRLIREEGPEVDRIVIAGGDGSIAAALDPLIAVQTPLAVVPLGTANDLARNLGLPTSRPEQLRLVAEGEARSIDLGSVNGRPFLNAVSIGLGAAVAALHQGRSKRLLGVLNYPRVLYAAYRWMRPFGVEIICDGERHSGHFVHLAVVNGRFHGGGLEPRPSGTIADGELDLYALREGPAFRLMQVLALLRLRGRTSEALFRLSGKQMRITTSRPRRANVDGEIIGQTPLDIELRRRALRVVVPGGAVHGE